MNLLLPSVLLSSFHLFPYPAFTLMISSIFGAPLQRSPLQARTTDDALVFVVAQESSLIFIGRGSEQRDKNYTINEIQLASHI